MPKGQITSVATAWPDVDALLREPGTRGGTFDGAAGKVALVRNGRGTVYGLARTTAVGVWVDTKQGTTSLGTAVPADGVIAFSVDHADVVTAVRLTNPDATDLARATLSED